jgi:carbon monoxide dehydrogenase subunit G
MNAIRILLTGAASALMISPSNALDLDAATLAKLQAGETVTKFTADKSQSAAGLLEAVIDIRAPREAVWKVLTDCDGSTKVFSGLKTCKVVKTEPGGKADVREHVISWSSLLPNVRSVFRSQYDAPKSITFNRTEGDLKELKGEWRLETLPDGATTRLHYAAQIVVGIPVPSPLVRAALENDMPKSMKAIRQAASGK